MKQSSELTSLIPDLIDLQNELQPVAKNIEGHHSKYANLKAVMEAVRPKLKQHGFSIVQMPMASTNGGASLTTVLYHKSGEFISGEINVPSARQNDPQAFGSAMSYGRRYAIMAILGVVTSDDDGESARISLEDYMNQIFSCRSVDELEKLYNTSFRKLEKNSTERKAIDIVVFKTRDTLLKLEKQHEDDACPI